MTLHENQALIEISYGRMALKAHSIERNLAMILALSIGQNPEEYNKLLKRYQKLTLGKQVNLAKEKNIFDEELLFALNDVVKTRNELIHDIGGLVADSAFSDRNSKEIIEYLAIFTAFLTEVSNILSLELEQKFGKDVLDELRKIAEEVVLKWHA
ncbi:hypothetical protein [Hydrogenovibrio thermophilus]|uniref:Uncharacterized protein n=1 Tax=Hydrogenovibrio thermophilus TaxID=265883 RepID=A0A410H2H4_9GAMM|nr:hypothetical protein [Hydrogenovibrio thermophilus]QAB15117.1 hypothetical protein EPV75_05250 [Hydrogenovibrio thermophilus]